jgi:hypothetical protein
MQQDANSACPVRKSRLHAGRGHTRRQVRANLTAQHGFAYAQNRHSWNGRNHYPLPTFGPEGTE